LQSAARHKVVFVSRYYTPQSTMISSAYKYLVLFKVAIELKNCVSIQHYIRQPNGRHRLIKISKEFTMTKYLAFLAVLGLALAPYRLMATPDLAYSQCPFIANNVARLACFDSYANIATEVPMPNVSNSELDESGKVGPVVQRPREGLSSHEPNKMLARTDANDSSGLYMDASLSLKHPLMTPVIETVFDSLGIKELQSPRLYMAFSSRFSQYIGTRDSAPVVPRRYNPELFIRLWDNYEGYWDVGYGHESNGQQINNQASFELEEQNFLQSGQPAEYARDGISRGWDYVSLDWTKQWQTGFLPNLPGFTTTHFEFRRFLSNGLLQGEPEEYNEWERQGAEPKPRDDYDGLQFSIQYLLPEQLCLIACFDRIEVMHKTGYGDVFKNNTNSIELTTSLFGIPFHIWAQSGYNSDLVDYYDYTNSWGIGVEFTR
jgi:hypothetical protein